MKLVVFFILFSFAAKGITYKVDCNFTEECRGFVNKLEQIEIKSLENYKEVLSQFLFDYRIKSIEILALSNNEYIFRIKLKNKITKVIYEGPDKIVDLVEQKDSFLNKEFISDKELEVDIQNIEAKIKALGYFESVVTYDLVDKLLRIKINSGRTRRLKEIRISTMNPELEKVFKNNLNFFLNRPLNKTEIQETINDLYEEMVKRGYYQLKLNSKFIVKNLEGIVSIELRSDNKFRFLIHGNTHFTRDKLIQEITNKIKNTPTQSEYKKIVQSEIVNLYEKSNFFENEVDVSYSEQKDKGVNYKTFVVNISEGKREIVSKVTFFGNKQVSDERLRKLINQNGSVLAKRGLYDQEYFQNLSKEILTYYHRNGFVFAKVSSPIIIKNDDDVEKSIEYRISEGIKTYVDEIKIWGVSELQRKKLISLLGNQEGKNLIITEIEKDISTVEEYLKDEGYYFAKVTNRNTKEVLKFKEDFKKADFIIEVDRGERVILDRVIIIGNIKTKDIVIKRALEVKKGDLITGEVLRKINEELNTLGLFSSIKITPVKRKDNNSNFTDILINVQERDFGVIELAPGYRTDLGAKLSTQLNYNNLFGMNRSVKVEAGVNHRFDYSNLDSKRERSRSLRTEYQTKVLYVEPYLLGKELSFRSQFSAARRHFYSFDADIFRASTSLLKDFNKIFSSGLKYQFETIKQFDAVEDENNGTFKIGSIIPTMSFDFRNDKVFPTKGALFNLSAEFANPRFLSQDSPTEINYMKLVSRNAFYMPFPKTEGVLALSISVGYQVNYADEVKLDSNGNTIVDTDGSPETIGFIPSIKVFRLGGIDTVRGFSDTEINRLDQGFDVSEATVKESAYFTNIKLEPRFPLSDSTMFALFFDAGQVFVNHYQPLSLRTSAGVSFKVLTPVGSLDFDYGFKLKREKFPDGRLERPGKFHVSIGFF